MSCVWPIDGKQKISNLFPIFFRYIQDSLLAKIVVFLNEKEERRKSNPLPLAEADPGEGFWGLQPPL